MLLFGFLKSRKGVSAALRRAVPSAAPSGSWAPQTWGGVKDPTDNCKHRDGNHTPWRKALFLFGKWVVLGTAVLATGVDDVRNQSGNAFCMVDPLAHNGRLVEAAAWPSKLANSIVDKVGRDSLKAAALCNVDFMSSCCSGFGTPSLGMGIVRPHFNMHGLDVKLHTASSCDIAPDCWNFLVANVEGCTFTNMLDMLQFDTWSNDWDYTRKLQAIMQAPIRCYCYCVKHKRFCPLYKGARLDVTGTPCKNHSAVGKRLSWRGNDVHVILIWCKLHRMWRTLYLMHENVPHFMKAILHVNMEDLYILNWILVETGDAGYGLVARTRLLCFMVLRGAATITHDINMVYRAVCEDLAVHTVPSDALLADYNELVVEARSLAKLRLKPSAFRYGESLRNTFYNLLTPDEMSRRDYYNLEFKARFSMLPGSCRDLVYHLGDNPDQRMTWSAVSGAIPTFRSSPTIMWCEHAFRPLTQKEKLAVMGFPVYPALAAAMGCDQLNITHDQARKMTGNAMQLANITVATVVCMSCVQET